MTETAAPQQADVPAGQPETALLGARPRLRHDVVFADTGEGVFLHHSDGGFVLRGKAAYRWVTTLLPYMTGEHTVDDLCDGLSDERRGVVLGMIRTLLDRGFIRDREPTDEQPLPADLAQAFAPQLNYIEHYADDAARRFLRFRDSRILVVGSGPTALATATGLLRNGLATLDVALPGPDTPLPGELTAELAELAATGCPGQVRRVPGVPGGAERGRYDLIIVPEEGVGLDTVRRLAAGLAADGPAVLPAVVVGGRAVLGPLLRPEESPCWICAMLRLDANLEPTDAAGIWRRLSLPDAAGPPRWPAPPVASMIGNALAFDAFRWRTGSLPAETDAAVVVQDLATLESARDGLLPHPHCPRCAGRPARAHATAGPQTGEPSEEERLERLSVLFGRYVGVFTDYRDSDLVHSPMKVGRVRLGLAGRSREVTAFDLHTVFGARIRAAEVAILAYVAGSGLPAGTGTAQPLAPVRPEELLTWSGLPYGDAGPDWMPARSLGDGTRREVPAGAVYPDERELLFEPTGAGAGCGRTEAEAVRAGLLSAFAYQGLRAAVRGERPAHLLAADELAGDTDAEFLLRAAKHLDLPVTLLRLPGAGPAHAVIALTLGQNRPLWSVGAGLDRGTAVRRALADLLGLWQLVGDDAASEQLDLGEPLMADVDPRAIPVEAVGAPAPAGPATVEDLLGSLAAGDRAAYAVDTTPRDLREAGYVTVRVLLSR